MKMFETLRFNADALRDVAGRSRVDFRSFANRRRKRAFDFIAARRI
jgi:hypothetical protein